MASIKYITSLGSMKQLPTFINYKNEIGGCALPRLAMVGRSNVGKSSLINSLTGNTKTANVSKQPGHTRKVNFFAWEDREFMLADLPGYGYAARSENEREEWSEFLSAYLKEDKNLFCAVLLCDGRHGPTKLDINALNFLQENDIPHMIVMTKSDTLKKQKDRVRRKREVKAAFKELNINQDRLFWTSSKDGDEVRSLLIHLTELKNKFLESKKA